MASFEEQVNNGSIHNDQHSVTQLNSRPQEQQLPAAVEAVISFGYSPDLVLSVHRQLARATRLTHTEYTVAAPGSASAHVTGSSPTRGVSAPALLVAVEEAVCRSDVAGTGNLDVSFNFSSTEVSPAGGSSGDDRWTVLNQSHSSCGGQSSAMSQPSTISSSDQSANCAGGSSSRHRTMIGNQSSTSEYPGRVTRSVEAFTSTPSSAQVRDGPDASSSPGVTSARNMASSENWSSASEVAVTSTFTSPSYPNPPSAHVKTSAPPSVTFSSASVEEDSGNFAPHHHGTQSTIANPNPESRTRDRMERGSDNAKATERRRRQLERLRALRAENRRLKALQNCLHCRQRPVALTFLPCGHFAYCQECGTSFEACPLCHKTILADVRTFLS